MGLDKASGSCHILIMATKRKAAKKTRSVRKAAPRRAAVTGRHPEHIAMMYRLGGAGIVIIGGVAIIFLAKYVFNL